MNWYYLETGQQRGPVTDEQFSALVQEGVIREDTFLWCQGMAKWQRYAELLANATPATAEPAVGVAVTAVAAQAPAQAQDEARPAGLRITRDEVPLVEREATCSNCGTVVPASQLLTIGASQLCPRCQASRQRLVHTGWGPGAAEPANPALRMAATVLDSLLCFVIVVVVAMILVFGGVLLSRATESRAPAVVGLVAYYLFAFVFSLHYFVGRVANEGGPPVMKWMGMKVVSASSGGPIGWWHALGRHIVFNLVCSFTLGLGNLVAFFDKQKRCLHDIICGTVVVKR